MKQFPLINAFFGRIELVFLQKRILATLFISFTFLFVSCLKDSNQSFVDRIVFLDVGQGDAAWIQTQDASMLVDVGPDSTSLIRALNEAHFPWNDTLDAVWISHFDKDHVGGLSGLIHRVPIKQIFVGSDPIGEVEKALISKFNIPCHTLSRGNRIQVEDWKIDVLHPSSDQASQNGTSNGQSLVLNMQWQAVRVLWTGDIEKEQEQELLATRSTLRADVIKIAHHGSKGSSELSFLSAVQPELAVLSVGQNTYGHPDPTTLANLYQILDSQSVLRTDLQGNIQVDLGHQGLIAWDLPKNQE